MNAADRTRIQRHPERARTDREALDAILDEAFVAHVAAIAGDAPVVLPFVCARVGDELVLHGSTRAGTLTLIAEGTPCCAGVTLLDGLVVARSAFHSSMNYRAAVVHGRARLIEDPAEKARMLGALTDRVLPGRTGVVRPIADGELTATQIVALPLDRFSVKVRAGGPNEPAAQHDPAIWGGVIPLRVTPGPFEPDAVTAPHAALPATRWD